MLKQDLGSDVLWFGNIIICFFICIFRFLLWNAEIGFRGFDFDVPRSCPCIHASVMFIPLVFRCLWTGNFNAKMAIEFNCAFGWTRNYLLMHQNYVAFFTFLIYRAQILKWVCHLGASDWSKACASARSYKGKSNSVGEHQWQHESRSDGCDIFLGRWVYDNISYPLYDEGRCPYMSDQLACGKHGRLDKEYQNWRWQPHGCNLKRYNS